MGCGSGFSHLVSRVSSLPLTASLVFQDGMSFPYSPPSPFTEANRLNKKQDGAENCREIAGKSSIDSNQSLKPLTQTEYNPTITSVTSIVTITTYVEGVKIMRQILTTIFAIAVMVFAFNANVLANEAQLESLKTIDCNISASGSVSAHKKDCPEISELEKPDQAGNESEVADSGNEGSTSAAQESDQ